MNEHMKTLLRLSIILLCGFMLLPVSTAESTADVVQADIIRAAVIDTLTAYAARRDLDIEISVPYATHVTVKDIKEPSIRIVLPDEEFLDSRVRVVAEFIDHEGEAIRRVRLNANLKIYRMVAVTEVDLDRHEAVNGGYVVMERRDVSGNSGFFVTPDDLEGMRTRRSVKAGTMLTKKYVEPIPLINRGDVITIKACIGSVLITANGTARESGGLHENIRVYNETTRKTIDCTIVDSNTVQIGGEGG